MTPSTARAPGRVNLIGEHTDYTGGFVLPCAIANTVTARFLPQERPVLHVRTAFGQAEFTHTEQAASRYGDWRDYVRGILSEFRAACIPLCGGELTVESTVPAGAGLSSSAAFEVALALTLLNSSGTAMDRMEIALLAQRAENRYTGTQSGIMDQFAVLFGEKGKALLLDTRTLSWEALPVPDSIAIVVCNTMQRRELNAGEYNHRRNECEQALRLLQQHFPAMTALRDLLPENLKKARALLPEVLFRRCRHVVTENARVLEAAGALRSHDVERFGRLMNASHVSLRDDYEVSSLNLDILVESAQELGAYGSRMTGAGFGGCTVSLVPATQARRFARALAQRYHERTGVCAEVYDGTPSGGASVIPAV
ncbi:MAG: galactokinase [Candidatus Baltobacteraceae bacterium]